MANIDQIIPKLFILHGPTQEAALINYIKSYQRRRGEEGTPPPKLQVNLSEYISEFSQSQQGYFHMCCKIMGDALGYSLEDIKRLVKKELWGTEIVTIAGVEIEIYKSMAKGQSNKLDYMDAIETLLRLAAEASVYIPDSDRQWQER